MRNRHYFVTLDSLYNKPTTPSSRSPRRRRFLKFRKKIANELLKKSKKIQREGFFRRFFLNPLEMLFRKFFLKPIKFIAGRVFLVVVYYMLGSEWALFITTYFLVLFPWYLFLLALFFSWDENFLFLLVFSVLISFFLVFKGSIFSVLDEISLKLFRYYSKVFYISFRTLSFVFPNFIYKPLKKSGMNFYKSYSKIMNSTLDAFLNLEFSSENLYSYDLYILLHVCLLYQTTFYSEFFLKNSDLSPLFELIEFSLETDDDDDYVNIDTSN